MGQKRVLEEDFMSSSTHHYQEEAVLTRRWSGAQFIAGAIGLFLTVVSGVALARLLPAESLTDDTVTVAAMGFTVIMAVIDLLLGLALIGAAGRPLESRTGMISIGAGLLAFGMVILIEPEALRSALGVGRASGLIYVIVGILAVIAGIAAPTSIARYVERSHVDDEVARVS
jgi:hypothetical protein